MDSDWFRPNSKLGITASYAASFSKSLAKSVIRHKLLSLGLLGQEQILMDPRVEQVYNYTSGSNIYEIPVYQRSYEWKEDKWSFLWNDIAALYYSTKYSLNKNGSSYSDAIFNRHHFIGTILSRATAPLGKGLGQRFTVIDGQQRLITLFIFLSAIRDESLARDVQVSADDLLAFNVTRDSVRLPRLSVNRSDADVFESIVTGKAKDKLSTKVADSLLGKAYLYFRWQLWLGENAKPEICEDLRPPKPGRKKDSPPVGDFYAYWTRGVAHKPFDLALLENCINYGLKMLEIILQPEDEDDAIIFETINARGTELEKFDLIRNSFFLRLGDKANDFFANQWIVFQKKLDTFQRPKGSRGSIKDQFIYDYLVFLGIENVSNQKLYQKWQHYVSTTVGVLGDDKSGEYFLEIVANPMLQIASFYPACWGGTDLIEHEGFVLRVPPNVRQVISEIVAVSAGPTIPLHMMGMDLWTRKLLTDQELLLWVKKIQSCILRLVLANEGLQNVRASALAAGPKLKKNPDLNTLSDVLRQSFRQPSDANLKNQIQSSNCAKDDAAPAMVSILRGIERQISKDVAHPMKAGVGSDEWQVEHIYPQGDGGPGAHWSKDIKDWKLQRENYEPLKYTLGNIGALTGTGNKKAGQKSFQEKKQSLRESRLGINESVLSIEKWTPKAIKDRSTVLLSYFLSEWPE